MPCTGHTGSLSCGTAPSASQRCAGKLVNQRGAQSTSRTKPPRRDLGSLLVPEPASLGQELLTGGLRVVCEGLSGLEETSDLAIAGHSTRDAKEKDNAHWHPFSSPSLDVDWVCCSRIHLPGTLCAG